MSIRHFELEFLLTATDRMSGVVAAAKQRL